MQYLFMCTDIISMLLFYVVQQFKHSVPGMYSIVQACKWPKPNLNYINSVMHIIIIVVIFHNSR